MRFPTIPVVIVAAISKYDRAIGYQNQLLWHIPDDLKRFKELTLGHPIIMGRKTHESIIALLGHPLPNRKTIVLTRTPEQSIPGVETAGSLEAAFAIAERENPTEIHIGGGASLYEVALPYIDKLYLTLVDDQKPADSFFPAYEEHFTITQTHEPRTHKGLSYQWVDLIRTATP